MEKYLKGRDVISKGVVWRVRDGKQIRIWGDNWLPLKTRAKITSPVLFGQENSCVAVLINQPTKQWRTDVIDHVFSNIEAEAIKSIPLSSSQQQDTLIWPFTPSRHYSVKSGYRFLHENELPDQGSATNSGFWRDIWSLNVPCKMKNFVWWACKDALPTKANLCKRKVITEATCDNCKVMAKDCSHALFLCSNLQVVFRTLNGAS